MELVLKLGSCKQNAIQEAESIRKIHLSISLKKKNAAICSYLLSENK